MIMRRSAFTLLEVLLALGIGLLLLAALYVVLDLHFRLADTGRDVIQQSTLARSLFTRIGNDVSASLAPPDPSRFLSSSQGGSSGAQNGTSGTQTGASGSQNSTSGSQNGASGAQTGSNQGTTNQNGTSGTNSSQQSSNQQSSQPSTQQTTTTSPFNLAVQGDSEHLTLFVTRIPQTPGIPGFDTSNVANDPNGIPPTSDVWRITYWLAGGGSEPLGLARQEIQLSTSDDATVPADQIPDEANFVIAEEVKSLSFSYWDGTTWQDSWDGTQAPTINGGVSAGGTSSGSSGSTSSGSTTSNGYPAGPPLAIAINIGLASTTTGEVKQHRHVIAIPTANGIRSQP
jgi:prepilin-type N-terminal cleavage/methylation domain-containing protein